MKHQHERLGRERQAETNPGTEVSPSGPRVGLALSGGGLRAAFFHLGVLARLAESGILHKVQVISTVSGGSIIGTAYYMLVRNLLNQEGDGNGASSRDLVLDLDRRMRDLAALGVRGRIFSNPVKNLAMASPVLPKGRRYSRTDRIGDLLDRHLYKHIYWPEKEQVGLRDESIGVEKLQRDRQVELRNLLIDAGNVDSVPGKPATLNKDRDRSFKIPELVINAASLNTGHVWRFEATRMGEHLGEDSTGPDGNRVLGPGYFVPDGSDVPDDLPRVPETQQDFPVGLAVAASAAVPGVFAPLAITRMYSEMIVQLVDGGLVDNQGVQSLRDHDCDLMIVSDGSGQMADKAKPGTIVPLVASRSTSVQADRIRDLGLEARYQRVSVVHLREGLNPPNLSPGDTWAERVWPPLETAVPGRSIHPRTLEALSRIRTDLDTFSCDEIDALACCGYLHMNARLEGGDPQIADLAEDRVVEQWSFLGIRDDLRKGEPGLTAHLDLGKRKFFRCLRNVKTVLVSVLFLAAAALAAAWFLASNWADLDRAAKLALAVAGGVLVAWTMLIPGSLLVYRRVRKASGERSRPKGGDDV